MNLTREEMIELICTFSGEIVGMCVGASLFAFAMNCIPAAKTSLKIARIVTAVAISGYGASTLSKYTTKELNDIFKAVGDLKVMLKPAKAS